MKVAILGGGSWGLALANVLIDNGQSVTMYMRDSVQIEYVHQYGRHPKYLRDFVIPQRLMISDNPGSVLQDAEVVVFATPLQSFDRILDLCIGRLSPEAICINASKGIHNKTLQTAGEMFSSAFDNPYVVLSGPSHAEEVSERLLTSAVSCSTDVAIAEKIQDLFMNDYFRIYVHGDVKGVEVAGALKNVIAIASGILTGLRQGDNAKAALISRGLFEISKLGVAMGCDIRTFMGLAGVGDLIVTATSVHSRNYRAGVLLGEGVPIQDVAERIGMVVEGMYTVRSASLLAERYRVEMPITMALNEVIYHEKPAQQAVMELMLRSKKHEFLESMDMQ